ncbi:DUF559 domain-containing protein [Legionella gresilensis]|uniref:DUF559 domain-containing protein n=1 Tax=Legionella gresilensis TaxID=91823 RepID=UPI001041A217|nr:DUF559 domain-containing protein [Legionella gresilensis]
MIAPTHLLKKVKQCVDFSFVNDLTEPCYSPNNGRPSISPELCFRMLLISYLFSIPSNRCLIEDVKYNCLAKARFRSIHNVQIQAYMAAIAINIKRLIFFISHFQLIRRYLLQQAGLVIELDGGQHLNNQSYDMARTAWLNTHGFKVLRFWNNDVLQQTAPVIEVILGALTDSTLRLAIDLQISHE